MEITSDISGPSRHSPPSSNFRFSALVRFEKLNHDYHDAQTIDADFRITDAC